MQKAQKYAKAIMALVEKGVPAADIIKNLQVVLARHGHMTLAPRIAVELKRLVERKRRATEAVLSVAREDNAVGAPREVSEYLAKAGLPAGQAGEVRTEVDDSLIGGWKLRAGDTYVDASYKRQLLTIFNNVVGKE